MEQDIFPPHSRRQSHAKEKDGLKSMSFSRQKKPGWKVPSIYA